MLKKTIRGFMSIQSKDIFSHILSYVHPLDLTTLHTLLSEKSEESFTAQKTSSEAKKAFLSQASFLEALHKHSTFALLSFIPSHFHFYPSIKMRCERKVKQNSPPYEEIAARHPMKVPEKSWFEAIQPDLEKNADSLEEGWSTKNLEDTIIPYQLYQLEAQLDLAKKEKDKNPNDSSISSFYQEKVKTIFEIVQERRYEPYRHIDFFKKLIRHLIISNNQPLLKFLKEQDPVFFQQQCEMIATFYHAIYDKDQETVRAIFSERFQPIPRSSLILETLQEKKLEQAIFYLKNYIENGSPLNWHPMTLNSIFKIIEHLIFYDSTEKGQALNLKGLAYQFLDKIKMPRKILDLFSFCHQETQKKEDLQPILQEIIEQLDSLSLKQIEDLLFGLERRFRRKQPWISYELIEKTIQWREEKNLKLFTRQDPLRQNLAIHLLHFNEIEKSSELMQKILHPELKLMAQINNIGAFYLLKKGNIDDCLIDFEKNLRDFLQHPEPRKMASKEKLISFTHYLSEKTDREEEDSFFINLQKKIETDPSIEPLSILLSLLIYIAYFEDDLKSKTSSQLIAMILSLSEDKKKESLRILFLSLLSLKSSQKQDFRLSFEALFLIEDSLARESLRYFLSCLWEDQFNELPIPF